MSRSYTAFLALAVAACSITVVSEEPQSPSAGREDVGEKLARLHTHNVHFSEGYSNRLKKSLKLPETASVLCSMLNGLVSARVHCCITKSAKDGKWESLVIDLNNNRDLTDDIAVPLPVSGTTEERVLVHNDTPHRFQVRFTARGRGSSNVMLNPSTGWKGESELSGKTVPWLVFDCNLSGTLDAGDKVHLALEGETSFSTRKGLKILTLKEQSSLYADSKWYTVTAASDGTSLKVEPYGGEAYSLSIDTSKITADDKGVNNLMVYAGSERIMIGTVEAGATVSLPEGTYRYLSASIPLSGKPLRFSARNLTLKKDTVLELGKPEASITVSQSGGKIHVNQKIVAPHNVSYSLQRAKPGPKVEVFAAENTDEPATSANMAYG